MADDLFTRDDAAMAAQVLETAMRDRGAALRRVVGAPRDKIQARRAELVSATARVLAAEQELGRIMAHRRVRY